MKNSKSKPFKIGAKVQWKWMGRFVEGTVKGLYVKPVSKVFRGHTFRRNGSLEAPAYHVKSVAGSDVLKSQSELSSVR